MKNNLRYERKKQNKLLKDVSKDLNIPVNTLSNYERGDREPKLEIWQKLADYYGVPLGYLQGAHSPENEDEYIQSLIQHTINSSNSYMNNAEDEIFKGWLMFVTSLYEQSKADQKLADVDDLITGLSLIGNELVFGLNPQKGRSGVKEGLNMIQQSIEKLQAKKNVVFSESGVMHMSDNEYSNFIENQNKKASE